MPIKFYFIWVFLATFLVSNAQISTRDSYADIKKIIRTYDREDANAFPYINTLIQKAKNEKNYTELYIAYRKARAYAPESLELRYADSCVWAAKKSPKDTALLGNAYLTKGFALNRKRQYNNALNYYLKAEKLLYRTDDTYAKHKALFAIGQIKNYLELYDEAIPMVDSANKYFKKLESIRDSSLYLYSLNALKDMHIDLGKYEQATQMYYEGKMLNTSYKDENIEALLDLYEGYNQYKQKNYTEAIPLIENTIPHFKKETDFSRSSMADFYLGLCYFDMGEKEKGISYFMKMDSVFVKEQYTRPRFRKGYEKMINYYKAQKQPKQQLWAINQLLAVDKRLNTYFKNITHQLNKEYDTVLLNREKEKIERSYKAERNLFLYGVLAIVSLVSIGIFWGIKHYKKEKAKQKPINTEAPKETEPKAIQPIQNKLNEKDITPIPEKKTKKRTAKIPEDVVQSVLDKLLVFENEKQFLEKGISQSKLAKQLKTNTTYLSIIINEKKGCNFSQYLNRLRINHLLNLFKTETKYKNYTISGLAEVLGYGSSKTFKSAFEEVLGKSISAYLEEV